MQFEQPKKEPTLVLTTTHNHNFALSLKTENGKLAQESENAIRYISDAGVTYNSSYDDFNNKIKENTLELEGPSADGDSYKFYIHDKLTYDPFKYKIKANTYDIENENEDIQDPVINQNLFIQINKYLEQYISNFITNNNITEINQYTINQINDNVLANLNQIMVDIIKHSLFSM